MIHIICSRVTLIEQRDRAYLTPAGQRSAGRRRSTERTNLRHQRKKGTVEEAGSLCAGNTPTAYDYAEDNRENVLASFEMLLCPAHAVAQTFPYLTHATAQAFPYLTHAAAQTFPYLTHAAAQTFRYLMAPV